MELVIYGAQGIALGAYKSIKELFPARHIQCFLVTKKGNNASSLCGIPVRELEEFSLLCPQENRDEIQVLIGTPENMMDEIENSLEASGFHNHVRLNSQRWAQMQKNALMKKEEFIPLEKYPVGFSTASLRVYKAKHYKDKDIKTQQMDPQYVTPIQVGAALTEVRVADVLDCSGENISERNGNYSELTGLYWVWKNRLEKKYYGDECYYGLAHYRRMLDLSEDDLLRLKDNDIDVILPYPMQYEPDIEEHHKRYLSDSEWSSVLQALREQQPMYADSFREILKQGYFYNYNIIIAKSYVLENYCKWLFPILFRTEKLNDPENRRVSNRYMGYVGETLETLYFMYNRDNLCITHTGCKFLT